MCHSPFELNADLEGISNGISKNFRHLFDKEGLEVQLYNDCRTCSLASSLGRCERTRLPLQNFDLKLTARRQVPWHRKCLLWKHFLSFFYSPRDDLGLRLFDVRPDIGTSSGRPRFLCSPIRLLSSLGVLRSPSGTSERFALFQSRTVNLKY